MTIEEHIAKSVMRCREDAKNKRNTYKFRVAMDKCAANYEDMLIDRANKLIAQGKADGR